MDDNGAETAEGVIFNIQTYSIHDGPGIRTTVFLKGCPLRCIWCQNPESQVLQPEIFFDGEICTGCGICVEVCAYEARKLNEIKKIAEVNEALCVGCGACISACPSNASIHKNSTKEQILRMIEEIV